jgi:hypothetical protein
LKFCYYFGADFLENVLIVSYKQFTIDLLSKFWKGIAFGYKTLDLTDTGIFTPLLLVSPKKEDE